MGTRNGETQGDSCALPREGGSSSAPLDQIRSRAGNTVFKSGPLFISSKGIGWTSWKKRWFILTRTSLVFFRSDPSVNPQKGSDVNLTLGGIDLNNSGSVVVKEDKKLLTVLFPDGRDGRAFTLKAETSEDLHDWKTALENALAQAPSAALAMGQNGIFRNEPTETVDGGFEKWTDKHPVKSLIVGRPILLALEDIDGAPSFLEKALKFIEEHGVKVEGILRQAADVDDVNRRVREYEEGKDEFSSEEDAHVIADCVKHVLRGLPSSPVPASCCKALLEACRADRGSRINAMRSAIAETFPEPNRRLLQRILQMMQIVASHKSENRMSSSAVSACMAPLLLRPLLAGDCELENDFNMGGDGSVQLLQAAAAANHAQAIVITLLEEYDNIFGDFALQEGSVSPELYSDSEESGSEDDELTDDDEVLEDGEILQDDEDIDNQHNPDDETEDESAYSRTITESSCTSDDEYDNKVPEESGSEFGSAEGGECKTNQMTAGGIQTSSQKDTVQSNINMQSQCNTSSEVQTIESHESIDVPALTSQPQEETDQSLSSSNTKSTYKSKDIVPFGKRRNYLGRTAARKNLSMESINYDDEDVIEIEKLELAKSDLQNKISREAKKNAVLHASLEDRKKELHERRVALEQDVVGLQAQLQKERDLRVAMEARLNQPLIHSTISPTIDKKTKAELEELSQAEEDVVKLKKKVAGLHMQLNQQSKNMYGSVCGSCGQPQQRANHLEQQKDDIDTAVAAPLCDRSRNSEDALFRADSGDVREETQSLSDKQRQKQQMDRVGTKSIEPAIAPSASSNSRKSGTKSEGTVATSSALSKLTTRLHFLKERRTQIVNELQNIENSRGSDTQMLAAPSRMNSR